MSSVSSLLDKLSKIKSEDVVTVKLTSTGKDVSFNTINVKQQKNLLKCVMGGVDGAASSLKEMNTILFDNIINKDVEMSSVDKYPALLALRKKSLGSLIKIENKEYNLSDLPTYNKLPISLTSHKVTYAGIEVNLKLPSLRLETEYLNKTIQDLKKITDDKGKETITIMYMYEIIKFIDSITFSEGTVSFNDLTINDKKTVVESLPVELNQQILNFINEVREFENTFVTFSDGAVVPINTLFLTGE